MAKSLDILGSLAFVKQRVSNKLNTGFNQFYSDYQIQPLSHPAGDRVAEEIYTSLA